MMNNNNYSDMTGKILVATPYAMEGSMFYKSLIYVMKHEPQGSIGLIFNKTAPNNQQELFANIGNDITMEEMNLQAHLGGPEEAERGFVLHSSEYDKENLYRNERCNVSVSSNINIIQDIANKTGPKEKLLMLGYTAWKPGEMEAELKNNLWIVIEAEQNFIFSDLSNDEKWSAALACSGISASEFIPGFATC